MRARFPFALLARAAIALSILALAACGSPDTTTGDAGSPDGGAPPAGTYENVVTILERSCVFSSCHGGTGAGAARLNFEASIAAGTLHTDLIDRPACMYDAMPLVAPGDPDGSWIMVKVAGPHGAGGRLEFTPDAAWDPGIVRDGSGRYPASTCPLTMGGEITFGTLMPQGSPTGLDAASAATLRAWIEAGAPGPE